MEKKPSMGDKLRSRLESIVVPQERNLFAPYRDDPVGYAHDVLGVKFLSSMQVNALQIIASPHDDDWHGKLAIGTGVNFGKSFFLGVVVNWFYDARGPCIIPTTAPSQQSVNDLLWKEVRILRGRADPKWGIGPKDFIGPSAPRMERTKEWWAAGYVAAKGENFKGRHTDRMLFAMDEAVGLAELYFRATKTMFKPDGNMLWICAYNPTDTSSVMYSEIMQIDSDWLVLEMSSLEHPNVLAELRGEPAPIPPAVSKGQLEAAIKDDCEEIDGTPDLTRDFEWPPDSGKWYRPGPAFEGEFLGRWPSEDEAALWSDAAWSAITQPLKWSDVSIPVDEIPRIGCDVARKGMNRTATSVVWGNYLVCFESKQGVNTMQTSGRLIELAAEWAEKANVARAQAGLPPLYTRNIPMKIDDDGVGCLAPGTPVLTTDGWVPVENVLPGTQIFSKDKNGKVVIETVFENRRHSSTAILKSGIYEFSFAHFLPYKTRKEHKWQMGSWDAILEKRCVWFDTDFQWEGKDTDVIMPTHRIVMPHGGTRTYREESVLKGDAFCEFLGWFLSEGSTDGRYILLTQKQAKGRKRIEKMLADLDVSYSTKITSGGATTYMIGHQSLKKWLELNCYRFGDERAVFRKKIPDYVGEQTPRRIGLFLDAYTHGDGFFRKKDRTREISCSTERMVGQLQTLFLKTNRSANVFVHARKGSTGTIYGRTFVRTADNYRIAERKNNASTFRIQPVQERYGDVYELRISGSSKLFMVKFSDEQPFWVHNGGVVDRLREQGMMVYAIGAATPPSRPNRYPDKRSELWFETRRRARMGMLFLGLIPKRTLDQLKLQAKAPMWTVNSAGQREVERKEAMMARLDGKSPDGMDSLNLACYTIDVRTAELVDVTNLPLHHRFEQQSERNRQSFGEREHKRPRRSLFGQGR